MFASALPFTLRVAGKSRVERGYVAETKYRVHGVARVQNARLVLEWSGTMEIAEAGRGGAGTRTEPIPLARTELPLLQVTSAELRSRWWRPRLELVISDLGAAIAIPGSRGGRVVLRLARRDWTAASDLVSTVELERADAMLRAADALPELPPGS
ncbi:MAG: hypothetical protein ACREON_16825 [Gemmatimonadaceae bacterium]